MVAHPSKEPTKIDSVTRLSVIDHRDGGAGLVFEARNVEVVLQLQDEGRTLKVWVR